MARSKPSKGLVLTERDRNLLVEIARMRLLTREQVEGLGFFSSASRANARLSQLSAQGLVKRVTPPLGVHSGMGIYQIGRAAIPVLAEALGIGMAEAGNLSAPPSPLLIAHSLAVVDIRLAFLRAFADALWTSEAECFHAYTVRESPNHPWRKEELRPDGFVTLSSRGQQLCAFIEADLGHVSLPRFKAKLERYATYGRCGLFAKRYGAAHFAVIVVTTGVRRLEHLRLVAKDPSFALRLCTFKELRRCGASQAVWQDEKGNPCALVQFGGAR